MKITRKWKGSAMLLLALGLLGITSAAFAEDQPAGSTSFWEKTKVTGQFNSTYTYNFNNPPIAVGNTLRVFDPRHNNFDFNLAEIAIENAPNSWSKFRLDLDYGQDAPVVSGLYGAGLGSGLFNVQQAYAELTAPVGKGITFRIGHFVTPFGFEVIESAYNLNTSRGLLFGFAIPFTHTGLTITYPFSDKFSAMVGIVNGWDLVADTNKGKTGLIQLVYKPIDTLNLTLGGAVGPEQAGSNGNLRGLIDFIATWTPTPQWTVGFNYDWGAEQKLAGCTGKTCWQGGALYVHWKPLDYFGLTLRGEVMQDDGARFAFPFKSTVGEGTLTGHFYLGDGWETRLEFRHDQSNKSVFTKSNGTTRKFQDTVAAEVVYSF